MAFGLEFRDLYRREGLLKLDGLFLEQLRAASGDGAGTLAAQLIAARENPSALSAKQHSELIIELAPYLEDFLGTLFGIKRNSANCRRGIRTWRRCFP